MGLGRHEPLPPGAPGPHSRGAAAWGIVTAPAQHTGLSLLPLDAVTALRVMGTGLELILPLDRKIFHLGSAEHPDVHIRVSSKTAEGDPRIREHVSRLHLHIQRKGSRLWITDNDSTNGTFIKDRREREGGIAAGESFRVGDVTLLALDEQIRRLLPTLRWVLGFEAHAYTDRTLELIASGDPLLLIGPAACEQRHLAEQIHATSARRGAGFAAIAAPLPDRDQVGGLAATSRGTAYLDLADHHRLPAWFVGHLFGETYQIRPIIAAPSVEIARARLGDASMPRLRVITIPAIKDRRGDVPALLDMLFHRPPLEGTRDIAELGEARLARLKAFDWPDNFDDLRRNAPKILAYIEAGFNERAAARRLGKSHQTVSASLRRIGL